MHASILPNKSLQLVIMILIVMGGMGFAIFTELSRYFMAKVKRWRRGSKAPLPRVTVHARMALLVTLLLLAGAWWAISP